MLLTLTVLTLTEMCFPLITFLPTYKLTLKVLCALLEIQSPEQLASHYLRGNIFESFVVSEYIRLRYHAGLRPNAFFWRDDSGHEIDLLLEEGENLRAVEIKSGETINDDYFKGLRYFRSISSISEKRLHLIYGGEKDLLRKYGQVLGWCQY